jgi:hypothetical protein
MGTANTLSNMNGFLKELYKDVFNEWNIEIRGKNVILSQGIYCNLFSKKIADKLDKPIKVMEIW